MPLPFLCTSSTSVSKMSYICVWASWWKPIEGKGSARNVGDPGLIPGLGRSPGEGNGNPLQYGNSCLKNPMDREAWQATVQWVVKNWTRLSDFTFTFLFTDY